ncbi:MAG: hypothetical protein IH586_14285 [Anaerolineaceae bacterium]|nr:hypothetical protein [Anaerolineaceae bacterium]
MKPELNPTPAREKDATQKIFNRVDALPASIRLELGTQEIQVILAAM